MRSASFSSHAIDWTTHVGWFRAHVHSERCVMYIVESGDDVPIGQVRFEIKPGVVAEVNLSIAAEWRGRGLAAKVLQLACDAYRGCGSETLVAHIRPENRASVRAFERAGFTRAGVERVGGYEALRLELRPRMSRPG